MTPLTRTGALAVVFGTASVLALGPAGLAFAQAAEPRTVHAFLEGDGSVDEATVVSGEGEAGELPVTMLISQAADGSEHTYELENTTVQKQTLNYLGADGQPATVEQDVALPLVGQLSVMLPASRTDVVAPGARLTQLADGSTELVWSLVLFGPIGSPKQEVSFTSAGDGEPVARLDVAAVQPSSTQGLSATAQAANATVNGNGILNTVATGASDGLIQLSSGVGELIAGLEKLAAGAQELNVGIVAAVDGAAQLADGSEQAEAGSGELAAGLGELKAGTGKLSQGAGDLNTGAGKIVAGLDSANSGGSQLAAGSTALATGATAAADGATKLSAGLAQIAGGLDQLSAAQGLPAALDGAKKLRFGVSHAPGTLGASDPGGLLEALGTADNPATVLGGLVALRSGIGGVADTEGAIDPTNPNLTAVAGLELIQRGLEAALQPQNPQGLIALQQGSGAIANAAPGIAQVLAGACGLVNAYVANDVPNPDPALVPTVKGGCAQVVPALPGFVAGTGAVATGVGSVITSSQQSLAGVTKIQTGLLGASVGLDQLAAGVTQIRAGVKSGDASKPGLVEGLDALVDGLATAVGGVAALSTGADAAAEGSTALAAGNAALAAGAAQISTGTTSLAGGLSQLYTGSQELQAGTGALSSGAGQLDAGAGAAAAGATALNAGLEQIADGQRQVADGLPAAADGSGQIADGLGAVLDGQKAVGKGLGDVKAQAVEVLQSQFSQGTELARQQLAGLDAASARIASDENGATTWVFTQSRNGLDAELVSAESNMGRNAAIGVGGALLLMTGIAGGYISGRRKVVA